MNISSKMIESYKKIGNDHFHREAKLYFDGNVVYKVFDNDEWLNEKKDIINYFMSKQFNETVNPVDELYVDGRLSGYIMPYFDGFCFRRLCDSDITVKIKILKMASLYLKNMHQQGIIVGDINEDNIMYNFNQVKFIDVDSYGYLDHAPIMISKLLIWNKHLENNYLNTKYLDIYLLNILTIQVLYGIDGVTLMKFFGVGFNSYMDYQDIDPVFRNMSDIVEKKELRYPDTYLDRVKVPSYR